MASPIQEAFNRIIREIYWEDSLEEAERRLASYLERMDEDLREVLLEQRRRFCNDPENIINIIRIEALSEAAEDDKTKEVLLLMSMIDALFLAQCTPAWARLAPREKARILAPLYRAWYGLRLATMNWPGRVDVLHLRHAYKMIDIAYERADERGILEQLYKYMERMSEKLLEEHSEE